jgi:hypothetical protein
VLSSDEECSIYNDIIYFLIEDCCVSFINFQLLLLLMEESSSSSSSSSIFLSFSLCEV